MSINVSVKEAATNLVREALDGQIEMLILRGVDEFAREGGDIDVLVSRNKAMLALLCTAERATEAGWKVVGIRDIGYLAQICLTKRGDADEIYRAVKIDFFDGLSWCAIGKDPLTRELFDIRNSDGEREAVGLATLLQKLLYAGYLRERDRARIEMACDCSVIEEFVAATGLPLSRAMIENGTLSKINRWRLRAASSGVQLGRVPAWVALILWRRIRFGFNLSTFPGTLIIIESAEKVHWRAVATKFQMLVENTGFPIPTIVTQCGTNGSKAAWRVFNAFYVQRGDTVLTGYDPRTTIKPSTLRSATSLHVRFMGRTSEGDDDLDTLITNISRHALLTLREIRNQ